MPQDIGVDVQYQASEVNEAGWLVYKEEQGGQLIAAIFMSFFLSFVVLLLPGLFCLGLICHSSGQLDSDNNHVAQVLPYLIIPACLISAFVLERVKQHQMTLFTREQRFSVPVVYTIGSAGFQFGLPQATVMIPWAKVKICYNLPQSICLISEGLLFPLPKRCFHSKEELSSAINLIIKSGVAYSRSGKCRTDIAYAGPAQSFSVALTPTETPLARPSSAEKEGEELSVGHLPLPQPITNPLERPRLESIFDLALHPQSELLAEPIIHTSGDDFLKLECQYSLTEMQKVDNILFFKYALPALGAYYIFIFAYYCLAPALFLSLISFETAKNIFFLLLPWAPLLLPGFFIHSLYVRDKRREGIEERLKNEQPYLIELSASHCQVRTRNSFIVYEWRTFLGCIETNEFYICPTKVSSVIIPRRLSDDRIKHAYVQNLLRSNIGKYEDWTG